MSLSTTPIVTIAAISPGEVTVTAAISGETVEATVTVLTATEAPPGTPLWSLQRVTPDNGTPISVLSAQNDDGVGADLFVIEGSSSDAIIRGVRSDGTEAWRRSLASESGIGPALADANGGVIVTLASSEIYSGGCDLVRVDGDTGFESWRVSHSGCFVAKPALLPSGILVVAVWDGWDQNVLGVQAATGSIVFETPVGGASGGCGFTGSDGLSDMTVGSDGRAYTLRYHWFMAGDCWMYPYVTYDTWYDVVVVQPTGSLTVVESLYEDHYTLDGDGALFESFQQSKIFPGAAGGLTVSWRTARNDGANPHFYVTTLNGGRSDVEVPVWVDAVGSDGSGYNALGAVDTVTGTTKWVSTEPGTVSAVLSDQSVVVMTYAGQLVRIGSTGQSTPLESVSSAADVMIEPDQRLVAVGGTIVAVPGDGVELDGLFPLQDGNTKRQRVRPEPALTVSRKTVTRGQPTTFRLTGVLPSEVTEWKFVPDDSDLPEVVRAASPAQPLVWSGTILASGKVVAKFTRNGTTKEKESRVDVAPRPGFSLQFPPPPAEPKSHGFIPPGSTEPMVVPSPPQPPDGNQPASAVSLYDFNLPYTFSRGVLVNDQGPNNGYRTVDGIQLGNQAQPQPHYVYVLGPDLEPDQEFYQRQCGTWSETNPNGFISGSVLRLNAIQHEGGAAGRSHYVQFIDAIAAPTNDLAKAVETIVLGGTEASDNSIYDQTVSDRLGDGVLDRIADAVGIEPCPNTAYDGSSGVCVYRGRGNYQPYHPCP